MIYALQSPIKCLYCSFYFFTEFFEENFTEVLIELTQQKFVLMKTSWRHLSSSSSEDILKTSSRRLDQDEYVRLGHTSSRRLQEVFKTSSRRLANTSSRRFQDVFHTSCKNVFKTSSRRLQDALKMSSKRLQDVLQRYLQDVFKTYHQVKPFLLTSLWEVFNTFLRRSFLETIIYRGICPGNTTSDKFMVSAQNLQER